MELRIIQRARAVGWSTAASGEEAGLRVKGGPQVLLLTSRAVTFPAASAEFPNGQERPGSSRDG